MLEGESLVFPLLLLLALFAYHDFVVKLVCLGLCSCLVLKRRNAAFGIAVGAALLPFLYRVVPGLFQQAVVRCGLRGGLFHLPAFHPICGGALLVLLGFGAWSCRAAATRPGIRHVRLAVAALIFLTIGVLQRGGMPAASPVTDRERMLDWVSGHTPAQSLVLLSPLNLLDDYNGMLGQGLVDCWDLVPAAERAVFACTYYAVSSAQFGPASVPMFERLAALGMRPERVRQTAPGLYEELARMDAQLRPEDVARLSQRWPISHVLLRRGRPWPGREEHREGELVLYSLRP